jgi:cytochrome P450
LSIFGADCDRFGGQFAVIAEESRNLEFAQNCGALSQMIVQIVRRRRAAKVEADDILGQMMRARDRDGLAMPDVQLAREALTLVIAGHETTASVLNWIWYLLATHPEAQARVVQEIREQLAGRPPEFELLGRFNYTHQFIQEALRSYPPLWLMTRKAVATDWLGDYRVPKGTEIYISPYLLQRHPRFWPEPDRFDPDRFDVARIDTAQPRDSDRLAMCPFGAGPRNCIGELFARTEIQVHLLTILPQLQLLYPTRKSPEFVAGVNLLSRDHFVMSPALRESPPV